MPMRATPDLEEWSQTDNGTYVSNEYSLHPPLHFYPSPEVDDYVREPFEFIVNRQDGSRWTIRYDERGRTETLLSSGPEWPRLDGDIQHVY